MKEGIKGILTMKVEEKDSAKVVGSGLLDVFSTPSLLAFIEKTCWTSVSEFVAEGETSVGTSVSFKHLKATPIGMKVTCESTLSQVDGKKLVFDFVVKDELDLIAEGRHERFVVKSEKFQERTEEKLKAWQEGQGQEKLNYVPESDVYLDQDKGSISPEEATDKITIDNYINKSSR